MKFKFTLLAIAIAFTAGLNAQQLDNSGFETWTSPSNPDSWATWESTIGAPLGLTKKDTANKVQGLASLQLKTDSIQAGSTKRLIPGFALYGSTVYAPPAPLQFNEAAFAFKPDTIFFAYRYVPSGSDSAYLEISASGPTGSPFGGGLPLTTTQGQWALIYIPVTSYLANIPTIDSMYLLFLSSIGNGVQGSQLNVDAIRMGYVNLPSAIQEEVDAMNVSVFPNPATDVVNIKSEKDMTGYYFEMVDAQGRIVSSGLMSGNHYSLNVSDLPKGNYLYRISNSSNIVVQRNQISVIR